MVEYDINLGVYELRLIPTDSKGDRMAKTATDNNLKSISSRIEHELYRSVKIASVKLDKPMADVIREALELWLTTVTSDGTPAGA